MSMTKSYRPNPLGEQLKSLMVSSNPGGTPMQLTDFVRGVPDDVWAVFEPIMPPVVWKGNGRKPKENRECLHALLYVLIAGIGWELLPAGFPGYKTIRRRLKRWLAL